MSKTDVSRPNDQISYLRSGQCIPTLNHRGHQMVTSSPLLDDWIGSYDGKNPLLDLRCAYGINAFKALDKGIPVIAVDMNSRHLQIVTENAPPSNANLLSCVLGSLPYDIPIPNSSVSGILLSEVTNFLREDEIQPTCKILFQKLIPGGILCVTAVSIHYFDCIDVIKITQHLTLLSVYTLSP